MPGPCLRRCDTSAHAELRTLVRTARLDQRLHVLVPWFDTASVEMADGINGIVGDSGASNDNLVFHWLDFVHSANVAQRFAALAGRAETRAIIIASMGRLSAYRLGDCRSFVGAVAANRSRQGVPVFTALTYAPQWLGIFRHIDGQFDTPSSCAAAIAGAVLERRIARCLDDFAA